MKCGAYRLKLERAFGADVDQPNGKLFSLTRTELTDAVMRRTGLSAGTAKRYVDAFAEALIESLREGERIELRGLGTFGTRLRKGGERRHPMTRAAIVVPPKRVAYFKAGKELRQMLAEESLDPQTPSQAPSQTKPRPQPAGSPRMAKAV